MAKLQFSLHSFLSMPEGHNSTVSETFGHTIPASNCCRSGRMNSNVSFSNSQAVGLSLSNPRAWPGMLA